MKKLLPFLIILFLATNVFAADEWLKTQPAGTTLINDIDATVGENNEALDRTLSTYNTIGLLYDSASAITATSGSVVCSNSDGSIRKMRLNTSTTSVSFTDIDTGAEASSTTYYVYANCDADATTATFKVSLSSSAPTGVTSYRKIGSFYNNSSSNIDQNKIYAEPYARPFTDGSGVTVGIPVYDYGTSASSSTRRNISNYFFAQGHASFSGSTTITISNLPFTSASTYSCVANRDSTSYATQALQTSNSSGSSMVITDFTTSSAAVWFCAGY